MSANDRQEGGSHYKTGDKPQHWDLAIMYQWDPFQYQITKYVMRWKDKHATPEKRMEDLKKARHFLDKYIENFDVYDTGANPITNLEGPINPDGMRESYTPTNREPPLGWQQLHQSDEWQCEGFYGDITQLYRHRKSRALYRAASLQDASDAHSAAQAGQGYTNQS